MEIRMLARIYDDKKQECKIGDTILIQTNDMDMPGQAIIKEVYASYFIIVFDDRLVGYHQQIIRPNDVLTLNKIQ